MQCVPSARVAVTGNEMAALASNDSKPVDLTASAADQTINEIEAGIAVLSRSFVQIVTSLGLGVTALARLFQTEATLLSPMLGRDRETLRTLRLLQSTLNAYMEYCDSVDPGDDMEYSTAPTQADPSAVLNAKVRRIIIKLSSETTQMPIEGVPITARCVEPASERAKDYTATFYSDPEGQAIIESLPAGIYEVTETAAPRLYLRDSDTHRLIVRDDGEYVWEGRLGLHWGNVVMVTIPHARDDSALFLHGEAWAADPDKHADLNAITPRQRVTNDEKPVTYTAVDSSGNIVHVPRGYTETPPEPDASDIAAAKAMITSILGEDAAQGAGGLPLSPSQTDEASSIKALSVEVPANDEGREA
jgi:hypothetical protein